MSNYSKNAAEICFIVSEIFIAVIIRLWHIHLKEMNYAKNIENRRR